MINYAIDANGQYVGAFEGADIPNGCTSVPSAPDHANSVWDGTAWTRVLSVDDFDAALTAHLDATARARRYDDRITCMVRAGFAGPFQVEAQAFALWADACNAQAYALLAEVQAGTRPLPATTQALIDALPPMVWPT